MNSNVAYLLHHLLLLQRPLDTVILCTNHTPPDLLRTIVTTATSTHPHCRPPLQIINVQTQRRQRQLLQPPAHRTLFVVCVDPQRRETSPYYTLTAPLKAAVPQYYAHTHLFLQASSLFDGTRWLLTDELHDFHTPAPFGTSVVATYRRDNRTVSRVTRDLRTWLPLDAFVRLVLQQAATAALFRRTPQQRVLRLRAPLHLAAPIRMCYYNFVDRRNRDSANDRQLVGMLDAVFGTCCSIFNRLNHCQERDGCRQRRQDEVERLGAAETDDATIAASVSRQFVAYADTRVYQKSIRWSARRFVLIVPSWWQLGDSPAAVMHRRQSAVVLTVSGTLAVALVLVRRRRATTTWTTTSDWSRLACDTWARLMAVAVPDVDERGLLAAMATVWGMLNAIALTGVVFDMSVHSVWRPSFECLADVWLHEWLPVAFENMYLRAGLLDAVNTSCGLRLNTDRTKLPTNIVSEILDHKISAFVIPDDLELNGFADVMHANNGCMVYRIIRDANLVLRDMAFVQPDFLQARLRVFAHRYHEHGLWHSSLATTLHRGELNAARFQRLEFELNGRADGSQRTAVGSSGGLRSLVVVYLVLNGLVACVWLAEVGCRRIDRMKHRIACVWIIIGRRSV